MASLGGRIQHHSQAQVSSAGSALTGTALSATGTAEFVVQLLCPIYNEGENVRQLYDSLISSGVEFDSLTFVYDLDNDTSLPYLAQMRQHDQRVIAEKNCFGPGVINALRWGFSRSRPGPVVVVMGDNSDKLSIIPQMIALWREGASIVCPSRYMLGGKQHGGPKLKKLFSSCAGRLLSLLGFPTHDPTNNFKLYDGAWLAAQRIESEGGFEVALELCHKAYRQGLELRELPTEWWDRTLGTSKFKMWRWIPRYLRWYLPTVWDLLRGRKLRATTTR